MIRNENNKKTEIIEIILNRIGDINNLYRKVPSLYFYKCLNSLRNTANNIEEFINDKYSLEIIYANLVAWDMNSRRAKMKYFSPLKF